VAKDTTWSFEGSKIGQEKKVQWLNPRNNTKYTGIKHESEPDHPRYGKLGELEKGELEEAFAS
jgi:hypothetical protein